MKLLVEQHPDGYVAFAVGLNGIVIGQGDTYGAALADVASAVRFHLKTFGGNVIANENEHESPLYSSPRPPSGR